MSIRECIILLSSSGFRGVFSPAFGRKITSDQNQMHDRKKVDHWCHFVISRCGCFFGNVQENIKYFTRFFSARSYFAQINLFLVYKYLCDLPFLENEFCRVSGCCHMGRSLLCIFIRFLWMGTLGRWWDF